MKIKDRQQFLGILAGAAVLLLAADRFVWSPLTRTWKARADRIVELQKNLNEGSTLLTRESHLRRLWSSMRTNTLPANLSAAESQMFGAFDQWSQQSRLSISSIKPQWRRDNDDYMTLECRADGFGSLEALSKFIFDIEQDRPAVKIDALELSARDNAGQQLTLGLQVSALELQPPSAQP